MPVLRGPACAGAGHRLPAALPPLPGALQPPRAWAAAAAAEAAAAQGAFWPMHDALMADQARLEDPHLWERARSLGLDLERFDADRRSDAVLARIKADFHAGVRAGVVTTPAVFRWTGSAAERVEPAELR